MADTKSLDLALFNKVAPIKKADSFRIIYANTVKMGIGPWDLRMTWGQFVEGAPNEPINEEAITVVMSPQYAKQVAKQWQLLITQYETAFGVIQEPNAVLEKFKDQQPEKH
jgi:Protein of unknown function (DUF3467)